MTLDSPLDTIDALRERLRGALAGDGSIRIALLFGSVAAGNDRAGSDIDVAVLFAGEPSPAELVRRIVAVEASLAERLQTDRVHVSQLNRADALFAHRAITKGLPILVRDRSEFADLQVRAIVRYHDTEKLRRLEWDTLRRGARASGPAGLEECVSIDRALVVRKLTQLRRALAELRACAPDTLEAYRRDSVRRRAIERLVQVIVEAAVDINAHVAVAILQRAPTGYHASFQMAAEAGAIPGELAARLAPSLGLRNRLVHEHDGIDDAIVFASVDSTLTLYQQYVEAAAGLLQGVAG